MLILHVFQRCPLFNKENKPVCNLFVTNKQKAFGIWMNTGSGNVSTGSLGPFTCKLVHKSITGSSVDHYEETGSAGDVYCWSMQWSSFLSVLCRQTEVSQNLHVFIRSSPVNSREVKPTVSSNFYPLTEFNYSIISNYGLCIPSILRSQSSWENFNWVLKTEIYI